MPRTHLAPEIDDATHPRDLSEGLNRPCTSDPTLPGARRAAPGRAAPRTRLPGEDGTGPRRRHTRGTGADRRHLHARSRVRRPGRGSGRGHGGRRRRHRRTHLRSHRRLTGLRPADREERSPTLCASCRPARRCWPPSAAPPAAPDSRLRSGSTARNCPIPVVVELGRLSRGRVGVDLLGRPTICS